MADTEQPCVHIAREFAREVITPNASGWERDRTLPYETLVAAAGAGLTGLLVPKDLGGKALSYTTTGQVMEELAAADLCVAFCLVVHNNLMAAIARYGSEAQRAQHLPSLLSMQALGAFLLTEPGGGSDAGAIATSARQHDDEWVINGSKAWVTNASHAQTLSVYVQTDPEQGWRGIAALLVDGDATGVVREPPYHLLGGHALGTGGFRFEGVTVSDADMLVGPGAGFKAAMAGIDVARANVAAMCCGMLRDALDVALGYVTERSAFGRKLADFQGLQWQLADVATDLHAARLMTYDAFDRLDRGANATLAAAHAKKFATRICLSGISTCMQALGAEGLKHSHPLARHLANAKIAHYLDGTTEIQNVVISRALLEPYRHPEGAQ